VCHMPQVLQTAAAVYGPPRRADAGDACLVAARLVLPARLITAALVRVVPLHHASPALVARQVRVGERDADVCAGVRGSGHGFLPSAALAASSAGA
jgi:hypothetical protein